MEWLCFAQSCPVSPLSPNGKHQLWPSRPVVCWTHGCYSFWAFWIFLSLEHSLAISSTGLLSLDSACHHGLSPTGSSLNSLAKCALNFPSAPSCSLCALALSSSHTALYYPRVHDDSPRMYRFFLPSNSVSTAF